MRKILTTALLALAVPLGVSTVPANAVAPTGWADVYKAKALTVNAYYSLSRSERRAFCRAYYYRPRMVVNHLATVPVKYGSSRYDARKGVRKGLRTVC